MSFLAATLALVLACLLPPARAADLATLPLERLLDLEINAASRLPLRLSESPASATVITAAQIRALGHRTLADVLRSVRGVLVSSDRAYAYLGVRGFAAAGDYNTRILLLIDGNRVNDTVYDQAFLGSEFPIDLDLVERVEFAPGQGSAVHGPNALFGVVNVVTRASLAGAGGELAASVGGGRSRHLRLTQTWAPASGGALLASATVRRADGRNPYYPAFDDPATNNGLSRGTDHERAEQLYLKYEHGGLLATLVHADRTKGLSGEEDIVFGDPRNRYRDTQTLASLAWARQVGEHDQWRVRLYGGRYNFHGVYIVDYPPITLNEDHAVSRWWGLESQWATLRFADHKLVAGLDLQASPRRDQSNRDVAPNAAIYLDDRRGGRRISLYAEDHWALAPTLSLTAGLRHDRVDDETGRFSHRLALVAHPDPALTLKAVHGSAFRRPNAYEVYYDLGADGGYKGNPDLDLERVRGSELVAEYRPSPETRWTVAAFDNRASGLLVQEVDPGDGLLVFRNTGALRTRGLELEFQYGALDGRELRLNYSRQQGNAAADIGGRSPRQMAKAIAVLPLGRGWTLGAEGLLIGRREGVAGHGLVNATLSQDGPWWGTRLALSVDDLFDRRPSDVGTGSVLQSAAPQDGRTLRLKLDLGF